MICIEVLEEGFMLKKNMIILICCIVIFSISGNCFAYVVTGYELPDPLNAKYYISSTVAQCTGAVNTYAQKWDVCSEIELNFSSTDYDIYYYGNYNTDNGTYAVANLTTNVVTFYYAFIMAPEAWRNEVIVHETGHCLGLAHCQPAYNSISVMREFDFNNKAYPLSDDIAGISYIY